MKSPSPKKSRLIADTACSLKIAKYPVRILHYAELGVLLGALLALGIHSVKNKFPQRDRVVWEDVRSPEPSPPPSPIIPANPGEGENPDRDSDGIPNEWETAHSHNPDNAGDAASDFDNDGLTTLQEYQLWSRTNGQAGNPVGKWSVQEIPIEHPAYDPNEYANFWQNAYVAAANDRGDVVVQYSFQGEKLDGSLSNGCQPAILLVDGNKQEIHIPGKISGYTVASDINERREVLLQWYSEDWSSHESYILKSDNSVTQLTLNGNACLAYRLNNFGDWIGAENTENGWQPVQVVDGMNILPYDNFTSWGILDINDFGQIIGVYYDVMEDKHITFTQLGSMFFSTGREGEVPFFDDIQQEWQWPAAINQWGEFTGGIDGFTVDGDFRGNAFFFDGIYHPLSGFADHSTTWPVDLSNDGMVLFGSDSMVGGAFRPCVWRDNVNVGCDALLPQGALAGDTDYLDPSKLAPNGKIFLTRSFANYESQSIIILTPDQDSDGDGMPDDWEEFYGFDPHVYDANFDSDSDGTNNLGEFLLRTDPHNPQAIDPNGNVIDTRPGVDTDGDGIPNNWEVLNGMNYDDKSDAVLDFDRDGYTNLQEFRLNTDPRGAPSYRIRPLGPFTGATDIALNNAKLGEGLNSDVSNYFSGDHVTEQVFLSASPNSGFSRPSIWSQARTNEAGQLSFYSIPSAEHRYIVAQSPSGAMLTRHGSNPTIFTYWSSPTATPITLSGAPTANNVSSLSNPIFSPSGNFLYAIRYNTSNGNHEPMVWKMPSTSSLTYKPVIITAPVGASISSWLSASINDYGIIAANGTVSGQTRALVWTLNTAATGLQCTILPNLINNGFTNTVGLSNHSNPIIAGTALISGNQQRATVWKYNSPTSFTVANLGTLPNGNFSNIVKISPNGTLAGISNTLSGNALKQQIFCATPVIPADSYSIDPTLYRLSPQGEPSASSPNITHLTNAGEMIAIHYSATSQQIKSLLRQGKSHSLDSVLPPSSGYVLETIHSINSQGTLFVTAWKDGAQSHLLLTPDRDTDGDGLPDAFENEHSFNPFAKNTPSADTDSDGLSDLLEYANGTHPRDADTDSDGMKDGWEVEWGLLPLDPSDALLDPDEDRVTNLRESQIGTIPTGIHKLEILHTDTEWQYPTILATGEDGTLIRTGASTSNDLSTESIYGNGNTQEILAQTTSNIVTLPARQGSYYYNNDWTYQAGSDSWQNFYPDASSGQIHGNIHRYNYLSDANIGEYFFEETIFLTPDITNFPEETGWIPWSLIEQNLRNSDLHNGSPPLTEWEYLSYSDGIVSPSGTRRLHRSDTWQQFLLNERGEFIELLPNDHSWQKLNDNGIAACYEAWNESSDGGSTYTYRPWLFLSDGQAHLLPHDASSSDYPSYELLAFSNDGKALLRNGYLNHQSTWAYRYFLFDTATGVLDLIRLPATANTSASSLSNQNGRLLIQGNKPSQITPDGTCIRLDALRIFDSADASPVPMSNIYPRALNPSHIASDGRITLTTSNSVGQTVILQITPYNDSDNDGIPDDFLDSLRKYLGNPSLIANDKIGSIAVIQIFVDEQKQQDTDGDGVYDLVELAIGTDSGNDDVDNDGIANDQDADPYQKLIDWTRSNEGSYIVVDLGMQPLAEHTFLPFGRENVPAVLNDHNQICREPFIALGEKTAATWDGDSFPVIWQALPDFTDAGEEPYPFDDFSPSFNNDGHTYHALPLDNGTDNSPGIRTVTVEWAGLLSSASRYGDYSVEHTHRTVQSRFDHIATIEDIWNNDSSPITITRTIKAPGINLTATAEPDAMSLSAPSFNFYSSAPNITRTGKILVKQDNSLKIGDIITPGNTIYGMAADPHDNTLVSVPGATGAQSVSTMRHRNGAWELMPMPGIMDMNADGVGITFPDQQIWRNGSSVSLDNLLKDSGWDSFKAEQINEKGTILGSAKKKGETEHKPVMLLRVEVVELSPKVKDENGKEIVNSEKPVALPKYNELIEEIELKNEVDQNRIAHREMKVKIHGGKIQAGKEVTWTMKVWGVKETDKVRGDWKHSKVAQHKNRFEESKTYGKYGYKPDGQESCKTRIEALGDDGYTAIRVNVPPIGWNHAEIKMKIEGQEAEIPVIRFIVPAVIVIDPGHGGDDDIEGDDRDKNGMLRGSSSKNNAKAGWWSIKKKETNKWVEEKVYKDATGVLEKTLTLEYSKKLRELLIAKRDEDKLALRIYMTRTEDKNLGGYERARLARDKGADTFLSIHFNSDSKSKTPRGSVMVIRTGLNNNFNEDLTFAKRFQAKVDAALRMHDPTVPMKPRAHYPKDTSMTSDVLGFYQDKEYHPIRSTMVEIDFIHGEGGDKLINGAATKSKILQSASEALREGLLEELNEFEVKDN